ncbi:hypothetical protein [Propionivibrio soli]|uniref:hypothetical protein n=1 Tax=Propionivibrio soli TaxID=2976531 RepID=UPI0021E8840B|nr:hypothetical protein [Propionivibrio soli]
MKLLIALVTIVISGCAVNPVQVAESNTPLALPTGADANPIEFRKIMTKIPLGQQIGQFQHGWWCAPGATITWRGGRLNITDEELTETFRKELEANNYPVVGDPYALFGDPYVWKAEILVAGLVNKVDIKVCFPYSGSPNIDIGNTTTLKGGVYMRVAWQIYSRTAGKVVHEVTTEGSYSAQEAVPVGLPVFLRNAFAANVKNFLADSGFRDLVLKPSSAKRDLRSL